MRCSRPSDGSSPARGGNETEGVRQTQPSFAGAALSARDREIRTPTGIITGDRDGVGYAHIHLAGCVRDIPRVRLTTLAGVGHSPHHVAPDRIAEVILDAERRERA